MNDAQTRRGVGGFTLPDLMVTISLVTILAGVTLPQLDSRRMQITTAQRLVIATLRLARVNAITKSQHFTVSFPALNRMQLSAMVQSPAGSGIWQVDPANVQTIQLPNATQVALADVGVTVEFNGRGMAPNLNTPLQIDTQDSFGVTKSLQVWPSGQINEL